MSTQEITLDEKNAYTLTQLADTFGTSRPTVIKRLKGIEHIGMKGKSHLYDISDVAYLIDMRERYAPPTKPDEIITDPEKMKPADRRTHFQAEDLKEAARIKRRRNLVEDGELLKASDVEKHVAEAFKQIAMMLDTLPDMLEMDGLVLSSDIDTVIQVIDEARTNLATRLTKLSPDVEEIENSGEFHD